MSSACGRIGIVCVIGLVAGGAPTGAAPPASGFIPPSVDVTISLDAPATALRRARRFAADHDLMGGPIGALIRSNPEVLQGWLFLNGIAAVAGTDVWTAVEHVIGDDACLGVAIEVGEEPAFVLAATTDDAAQRDRIIDGLFTAIGIAPDRPSRTQAGSHVFALGDDLEVARAGSVLVISNRAALLDDALDGGRVVGDEVWFDAADERASDDAIAWMTIDPALRDTIPPDAIVPVHAEEALPGVLFGGWQAVLSDLAGAFATVETDDHELVATVELTSSMPLAPSRAGFLPGLDRTARWSGDQIAGYIGEIDLRRSWAQLVADRESFLTLAGSAELVDFTTGLSNVMGGLDFVEDVLTRIDGPVRLIASDRSFDGHPVRPTPSLPSFALVADLQVPEGSDLPRRLYSAGQIALSVVSMDQSQKEQVGLLLDVDRHSGHRIIFGRYPDPADASAEAPAEVGVRHNFDPGMAVANGSLVIASSREMLEATLDAITAQPARAAATMGDVVDRVHVKAKTLVSALERNREALVVGRMLEEGRSRAEADREINAFFALLRLVDAINIDTRHHERGCSAELRLAPVQHRD